MHLPCDTGHGERGIQPLINESSFNYMIIIIIIIIIIIQNNTFDQVNAK